MDIGLPPELVDRTMGIRAFREGPMPPSIEEIQRLLSLAGASRFLRSEIKKLTGVYHLCYRLGIGPLDLPVNEWRQHSISGDFVEALEQTENLRREIEDAEQRRCSTLGVEVNSDTLAFLLEKRASWGKFTYLTHVEVMISIFDDPLAWEYLRHLPKIKTVTFNAIDAGAWEYLPDLTRPFLGLSIEVGWILDALQSRRKFGSSSYVFNNALVAEQGGIGPIARLEVRHWGPYAQSIIDLIASCESTLTCLILWFGVGMSCVFTRHIMSHNSNSLRC
jgi:hypothetical protein